MRTIAMRFGKRLRRMKSGGEYDVPTESSSQMAPCVVTARGRGGSMLAGGRFDCAASRRTNTA